eukprot:scaffold2319_cov83-Alexandrium_tamarense.AAC.1
MRWLQSQYVLLTAVAVTTVIQWRWILKLERKSHLRGIGEAVIDKPDTTNISSLMHHDLPLTQDDNCKRMFEWSMLDRWNTVDPIEVDYENLPQTKHLHTFRIGGYEALGEIDMNVTIRNQQINLTV